MNTASTRTHNSTLVVYHSRTGFTRRVAKSLAAALHADIEEIVPEAPRAGLRGYWRCAFEAIVGWQPALRAPVHDPAQYELVVIGTPVWVWSLASPVRSWLERHGRVHAKQAFFCTLGGSGAQRAFAHMQALCRRPPQATLALTDAEVNSGFRNKLNAFVDTLSARAPARMAMPAVDKRANAQASAAARSSDRPRAAGR